MIRSFGDQITKEIFHGENSKKTMKLSGDVKNIAIRKLDQLNVSININDLRIPPGNRLEKLKGDLKNYFRIRINDQFRIIFQWEEGEAFNVQLVDYH